MLPLRITIDILILWILAEFYNNYYYIIIPTQLSRKYVWTVYSRKHGFSCYRLVLSVSAHCFSVRPRRREDASARGWNFQIPPFRAITFPAKIISLRFSLRSRMLRSTPLTLLRPKRSCTYLSARVIARVLPFRCTAARRRSIPGT